MKGHRILPVAGIPCFENLDRIPIKPERAMVKERQWRGEIPDQEHFRVCPGQFSPVFLRVVEVDSDLGPRYLTAAQNLPLDLEYATGRKSVTDSFLVTRGMEKTRKSQKSEIQVSAF